MLDYYKLPTVLFNHIPLKIIEDMNFPQRQRHPLVQSAKSHVEAAHRPLYAVGDVEGSSHCHNALSAICLTWNYALCLRADNPATAKLSPLSLLL